MGRGGRVVRPPLVNGKGYAMRREIGRDGEEPRELGRVPEEGLGAGAGGADKKVEEDWTSWGTEDPAFFIKPSDEK